MNMKEEDMCSSKRISQAKMRSHQKVFHSPGIAISSYFSFGLTAFTSTCVPALAKLSTRLPFLKSEWLWQVPECAFSRKLTRWVMLPIGFLAAWTKCNFEEQYSWLLSKHLMLSCFKMTHKPYVQLLKFSNDWWAWLRWVLFACTFLDNINCIRGGKCPPAEAILPCRCSLREREIQIWCSHSNLPQIMDGLKAIESNLKDTIDELVLENNQLPALPGRFFGTLRIVRLMLRYNNIERVSNGWLNELEGNLVEVYIVEPQLRSIPIESLNGMINMVAITIQSDSLKHLPDFSGLQNLAYLSVFSKSLNELQPHRFRILPKLKSIHISGSKSLNRLESGVFDDLTSLESLDLSRNGLNWIHLRALTRLPKLTSLKLSHNKISDVGMIGRIVKDLENLLKLRLDHNIINTVGDGSFVDLPNLIELHLNDNRITELQYGAFLRVPMLKTIYLHNNLIQRIHPESFLQASGGGVEIVYIYNNEIARVSELGSLLEALPALKFLDISNNYLMDVHFGILRGHGTLEQLYINNNLLRNIERDALMAMPALRELRLRNNSLSHELAMPFWNLPGLKGLDLSLNNFHWVDSFLLGGLPSLRRLDLSENRLSKLDPSTFIHNPMLETLNISGNDLLTIHSATFRRLDRLFEVDASFNQLQQIIPGLPKIVERISVRGNQINVLPMANSKSMNLPHLRMLDLSLNRLEQIPKYAFQGLRHLRVLSLANNRLSSLDDTVFIGSHRLELLHLQENQLIDMDDRVFRPLWELKNLNLRNNQVQAVTDNLLSNNTKLEHLDMANNSIRTVAAAAFQSLHTLEHLDLSMNSLNNMPMSLSNLANLRIIDLSYNEITQIRADIVSNWRHVVEIRLSNNLLSEIKQSTFRNLPKLQYLDLSSNEIAVMESSALKNLHELQELVLADNKLEALKERVFEDLPNLLATHLQYNSLHDVSKESFFNSPSLVFLNLSNNHFRNMDNISLVNMRNLEVLDLSANSIKVISTMPLKAMNWLVELKMDNNEICKIRGSPFQTMPRLRVLSLRNNRLRTLSERTFKSLRGNIAIIDIEGNPIDCSCDLQWLSVWIEETNFPYPGPRCQDGRLLRSSRIDKKICADNSHKSGGAVFFGEGESVNHLPLLNDHGDIFHRELNEDYNNNECEFAPGDKPLASDSEYFYDQYVDYTPGTNENLNQASDTPTLGSQLESTNTLLNQQKNPQMHSSSTFPSTITANVNFNNTVLNTKYFTKQSIRKPTASQSTSSLTFFGYPLNGLGLNRFFGLNQGARKNRGENVHSKIKLGDQTLAVTSEMPATHRIGNSISTQNHGRVRMYQPNSAEFEKYLKTKGGNRADNFQYQKPQSEDVKGDKRFTSISSSDEDASSGNIYHKYLPVVFKTGFRVPPDSVERGGFKPIMPQFVGGFKPVHDPTKRKGHIEIVTSTPAKTDYGYVPIATTEDTTTTTHFPLINIITEGFDIDTHYKAGVATSKKSNALEWHTTTPHRMNDDITYAITTTSTPPTLTSPPITSTEVYRTDAYDDLETQPIDLSKPPSSPMETTTSETILLIPPSDELADHLKKQSWLFTTKRIEEYDDKDSSDLFAIGISTTSSSVLSTHATISNINANSSIDNPTTTIPSSYPTSRGGGTARSTITKIYTPPQIPNQFVQEYQRSDINNNKNDNSSKTSTIQNKFSNDGVDQTDRPHRKDGMDWYYESFKKSHPQSTSRKLYTGSSSLRSSIGSRCAFSSTAYLCYALFLNLRLTSLI